MRLVKYLVLILVVLAFVVGRAMSDRGAKAVSGTREFAIDGRTFLLEDPACDGLSLVERELAEKGIDTLPISEYLSSVLAFRSVEPLREEPAEKGAHPLPRGLDPDHVLRLETGAGPVEIAIGSLACRDKEIFARLRSSGWECRETDGHGIPGAVAQFTTRKETSLVLIEKDEGRFLAIRRAVR